MYRKLMRSVNLRPPSATITRRVLLLYASSLFFPFITAVLSLLHPRDPASRNVIWIFVVFYGAVFYIAADSAADSARYATWLEDFHREGVRFGELTNLFLTKGSQYQDIYQPLLTLLVSLFIDNYALLFSAFGVVFGYFYTRNIWFLIDRIPGKIGHLSIFLLTVYAFTIDVGTGLNGVRMWTALHMFIFGVMHFYATGNCRYLVVLFLTPLVHFSFWLPCILMPLIIVFNRFAIAIYIFFITTFFIAALDLSIVKTVIDYFPIPIEDRVSSYINKADYNPDLIAIADESKVWFIKLNRSLTFFFFVFSANWLVWRGALRDAGLIRSLLLTGMLLYGVINIVNYIPSLGRFYNLAEMLLLAAYILYLTTSNRRERLDFQVFSILALLLIIDLALGVRFMLGYTSAWLIFGNFVVASIAEADQSLYESIFWVLRSLM